MGKIAFDLKGRVALVTGAGQGVGRRLALTLASHNAKVAVNDFEIDRAKSVVAEIEAEGGTALAVQADVGDAAGVQAMVEKIEGDLGPVDILVNNAGNAGPEGFSTVNFWQSDPADWDRYFHVNLKGVMTCCRMVTPGMVARGYGRIVTIVSDAGRVGLPTMDAYAAAKAGAAGFSRSLAKGVGRYGITVNTISLSNMSKTESPPTEDEAAARKPLLREYIVRRQGFPMDVAPVVLLLASEESSWITGQNYPVNGGYALSL